MKTPKRKLSDLLADRPYIVERDGVVTICPVHSDGNEAHPSLRITINDKGCLGFKCRSNGCGFKDIIDGLGIKDVCNFVYGDINTNMVNEASEPVTAEHIEALRSHIAEINPDQKVLDYVKRRWGLSYDDVAALSIGKDSTWKYAGADNRAHRIFVPFYGFDGVPRGGQARATGDRNPRWSSLKNPEGHAWERLAVFSREDGIEDYVIITEGPGDGLTAYGAGYSAIAIRGATLTGNDHLARQLQAGTRGKRVIIAGDNDKAGQAFAQGVLSILPSALLLSLPKGVKDLSAWFESAPEAFGEALMGAIRNARGGEESASDEDEEEVPKTDQQMAKRIIRDMGGLLRFVPGVGLYRWVQVTPTSGYWDVDETALVVTDFVDSKGEGWERWESANTIMNAARQLERQRAIIVDPDELDAKPHLVNVANGTFDVLTGELRPADPNDLITYMIPHNYNPEAKAERWGDFLREVFLDDGVPEYMQRLIGYGITGYTTEEIFAIFYGHGANGKSKFLEAVTYVFGEMARTSEFATFTKTRGDKIRNDIARLRGARLVHANEGGAMDHMDEALLKTITGQDKMTARFLNKENFEFTPTFLLLLASNFKPNFLEQGHGLWRRIRLVNFRATFEGDNRDFSLGEKLKAEAEGILAWALHGAVEWRANGLQDPDSVMDDTKEYRDEANGLDGFTPGWFEITKDDNDKVLAKDVWTAYNVWCSWNYTKPWTQRTLNNAIVARGAEKRKATANKTTFFGLKWVGPEDSSDTLEELIRANAVA